MKDELSLGRVVKELRLYRDISQKELCDGVCTQSFISKFENGDASPSAEVLYKIAVRLGVNMNYFFEFKNSLQKDYGTDFCRDIRKHVKRTEYEKVYKKLKSQKKNPLFRSLDMQKFFLWNEGLCYYYVDHDSDKSIKTLKYALKIRETADTILTVRDVEIMNSIANVLNEENRKAEAIKWYQKSLDYFHNFPLLKEDHLYLRILYNYAVLESKNHHFQKAIDYCSRGIEQCLKQDCLYLLGLFLYEKGFNERLLYGNENGRIYMEQAFHLFKIQGNERYCNFIKKTLKMADDELSAQLIYK